LLRMGAIRGPVYFSKVAALKTELDRASRRCWRWGLYLKLFSADLVQILGDLRSPVGIFWNCKKPLIQVDRPCEVTGILYPNGCCVFKQSSQWVVGKLSRCNL